MAPQHLRPRFRFTIYGQYKNFLSNCLGLVCFPTCHSLLDYKKGAHSFVFYSFVIGGHLYLYWISYLLIQPPWHKGQCCIVRKFIHVHVQLSLGLSLEAVYGTTCCGSLALYPDYFWRHGVVMDKHSCFRLYLCFHSRLPVYGRLASKDSEFPEVASIGSFHFDY